MFVAQSNIVMLRDIDIANGIYCTKLHHNTNIAHKNVCLAPVVNQGVKTCRTCTSISLYERVKSVHTTIISQNNYYLQIHERIQIMALNTWLYQE
jgi:hypothetical protein